MSDEPRTRHLGAEELTRALSAFSDDEAARPIQVARGKRAGDPATKLGVGVPREFELPRVTLPRPSVPSLPRPSLELSQEVDASLEPTRGLRAWHAWLAAIVLGGFALGGVFALGMHATRATARVPPATLRVPPALPAGVPVTTALEREEPRVVDAIGPANATRRSAVDALLAGRTRIALEHYRRVIAQPVADREAIEQVMKLLARELKSCEQEAGTPCGF